MSGTTSTQSGKTLPTIEFVNHASVLLSDGVSGLLSDPWYFGEVFHNGWALLEETPDKEILRILKKTTHIWLSHEHPDHFSPAFFKRYQNILLERRITVLFQHTLDGRLANFIRKCGLPLVELSDGQTYAITPHFRVKIARCDLYDSALLVEIHNIRVFNLNDCPLHSVAELEKFAAQHGPCDVLLTQFSYAAWKGGKAHPEWRKKAARHKLTAMHRQISALKPISCLLFANFVRFSNQLNHYLNDAVNTPDIALKEQQKTPTKLVFMAPGEIQELPTLRQAPESLEFWRASYQKIPEQPLSEYTVSESLASLKTAFQNFKRRLYRDNSIWLLRLGRRLLPFHPFEPTTVYLLDQAMTLEIDPLGDIHAIDTGQVDITLHSSSLAYLFQHEFGFDTLFVNGCFEEIHPGGFERFAKCFAIGNLNATGVGARLSSIRHTTVLHLLLKKLAAVRKNLSGKTHKNERKISSK